MPISDIFYGKSIKQKEEKDKELRMVSAYAQLAGSGAWKYLKAQLELEQKAFFSAFRDSKFNTLDEVRNLQSDIKARELLIQIVEDNAKKLETLKPKSADFRRKTHGGFMNEEVESSEKTAEQETSSPGKKGQEEVSSEKVSEQEETGLPTEDEMLEAMKGKDYQEIVGAFTKQRQTYSPLEQEAKTRGYNSVVEYVEALRGGAISGPSGTPIPTETELEQLAYQTGLSPEALKTLDTRYTKTVTEMQAGLMATFQLVKGTHWEKFVEKNPKADDMTVKEILEGALREVPQIFDMPGNWYKRAFAYVMARDGQDLTDKIFRAGQKEALKQQEDQRATKTNTGGKPETKEPSPVDLLRDVIAPDRK